MTAEGSGQDVPPEHLRFAEYRHALSQVPDGAELALVAEILRDPDVAMAQSAVVMHLDWRAGPLIQGPGYAPWAQAMANVVASRPFLLRRLHEWSLLGAITRGQPWSRDALTAASDWLQLKVAGGQGAGEAIMVLAEAGRTKRIRATARAALARRNEG